MIAATSTRTGWAAVAVGLALAAFLVHGWKMEGGAQVSPADVELVTRSSGELAVTPDGVTSVHGRLRASEAARGFGREIGVRNASGGALDVTVAARPQTTDLDRVLSVRVVAGGRTVFEGDLGELRAGSAPFALASHEETRVQIDVWIPASVAESAWRARTVDVPIELSTSGNHR